MDIKSDRAERYEKINDIIYDMSKCENFSHSNLNANICLIIKNQIVDTDWKVFMGNYSLFENSEKDSAHVIPDIMIIGDIKNIYNGRYYGTPNFVVETISPSTVKKDRGVKMDFYAKKGIAEYWIISCQAKSLEIYYLQDGRYRLENAMILVEEFDDEYYNADTIIRLKMIPNVSIKLFDVFNNIEVD